MKFWAVLGSGGCREKKFPTAMSAYATFWVGFHNFMWARKHFQIFKKYILASALKCYII